MALCIIWFSIPEKTVAGKVPIATPHPFWSNLSTGALLRRTDVRTSDSSWRIQGMSERPSHFGVPSNCEQLPTSDQWGIILQVSLVVLGTRSSCRQSRTWTLLHTVGDLVITVIPSSDVLHGPLVSSSRSANHQGTPRQNGLGSRQGCHSSCS